MKKPKFKQGDLVRIWSPAPSIISNRKPRRFIDHDYGHELKSDEVIDYNHGKIGLIAKINLHLEDNPIYNILINGRIEVYGQHCLREVNK